MNKTITIRVNLSVNLADASERTVIDRWIANQPTVNPMRDDTGIVAIDYNYDAPQDEIRQAQLSYLVANLGYDE